MKKHLLLGLLWGGLLCGELMAQVVSPPVIEWQRSFGGTNAEDAWAVRVMPDGGYVVGGSSASPPSGNKTSESFGDSDFWVVRMDASGNKLWERTFGGTSLDYLADMILMPDGGLLLGGLSHSGASGNKSSASLGSQDFWLVRLDAQGTKLWDRSYGTTNSDTLRSMQMLPDGGLVLAGHSVYQGGQNLDWLIIRTDAGGEVVWQRTLGGSAWEQMPFVQVTANGDLCIAGQSASPVSGDKTSAGSGNGSSDYWLVRLDSAGNKLWDKTYWGSSSDYFAGLEKTAGGGLLLGGTSSSPPGGGKTSPLFGEWFDFGDYWVVQVDEAGNKIWEKSFGGSRADILGQGIQTADGGFILGGSSGSPPGGNKTSALYGPEGFMGDFWVVRLNGEGEKIWEESYGGPASDALNALAQTPDGGFILVGSSSSPIEGNKTVPAFGRGDLWVVKLGPDALSTPPRLRVPPQSATEIGAAGSRLILEGVSNQNYVIEYSQDQQLWQPLRTNRLSQSSWELLDVGATNAQKRFYRARVVP